jgi:RNA polymerase sigma factor (sigma-70 family)
MNGPTDQQLLTSYAETRAEAAFGELVRRHVDLVHSAARRLVVDPHLAEDVTQSVFVALARQAAEVNGRLTAGVPLSGWLHLTTRNLAAKVVRAEMRRRDREREAFAMQTPESEADEAVWSRIAPHLDHALAELSDPDRAALLLRFFERKTAREIGTRLGTGEEAAQKRISRALERLRAVFVARGLAVPAASLGGVLTANAVQTAPAALTGAVLTAVGVAGTAVSGVGLFHLMTTAKLKLAVAMTIAAGVAVTVGLQHRETRQLQAAMAALRAQAVAPAAPPVSVDATSAGNPQLEELLRLRGEVAQLRRQQPELERLRAENIRLRAAPPGRAASPADADADREAFQQLGMAKMKVAKDWAMAFWLYADANANVLPATFEQARKFYPAADEPSADADPAPAADFEIMFSGAIHQVSNPASAIVLREKVPFSGNGRPGLYRTYAFTDGHSEIKYAADGNFEEWEQARRPVLKEPRGGTQ